MSGIWVKEGFYECGEYLTQKPRKNKKIKSCLQMEKNIFLVQKPPLETFFNEQFNKHFESGCKMSGIWVEEGFYECGEYLTQKTRKNKKIKSFLEMEKKIF